MGDDPPHRPSPGGGSAQRRAKYHSEETKSASGWDLGISTDVYGDARGGIRVDGGVRSKEAEYGFTIHYDATNYVPMQ